MPAYDHMQFEPPAPIAKVTLRHNQSGKTRSDVRMLIDSGADVTLLPENCVRQLGIDLDSTAKYELMAFDGSITYASAVYVDLLFLHKTFKGRFLLTNQAYGILGRDILNHLSLLLDGPRDNWEEVKGGHLS